jgi:protease-4
MIFAEPSTITGSIGVFGILPSFEGTLRQLNIGVDGVRTTPLSGQPDVLRGPSPEANRLLQTGIESSYRRFIELVARARHLSPARVNEIAQGRVWSGGAAHQLGLVDRFGSLDDAVQEAARRAGIAPGNAKVTYLERRPTFLQRLFTGQAETDAAAPRDVFSRLGQRPQELIARALHDAQQLASGPAIQARCLECPAVAPLPQPRGEASGPWLLRLVAALVR